MTVALSVALVVLSACAPAPAERLRSPRPTEPPMEPPSPPKPPRAEAVAPDSARPQFAIAAPRPPLPEGFDVHGVFPDPSGQLRWPRTTHPSLEPAYDIARAFADPGVTWQSLCQRGAQNRRGAALDKELLAYLHAWCAFERHDIDTTTSVLADLTRSQNPKLVAAARLDLANLVVDAGPAELAQRTFVRTHSNDVALYDLVSATYAEVGKLPDAAVFNDLALGADTKRVATDTCHRLTRSILLSSPLERRALINAMERSSPNPECSRLVHELRCWNENECRPYYADAGIDPELPTLIYTYQRWPTFAALPYQWGWIVEGILPAIHIAGAPLIGTVALEAQAQGTSCADVDSRAQIQRTARKLQDGTTDPNLWTRLAVLADPDRQPCHPDVAR